MRYLELAAEVLDLVVARLAAHGDPVARAVLLLVRQPIDQVQPAHLRSEWGRVGSHEVAWGRMGSHGVAWGRMGSHG
eukprot:1529296-Prymnesium_polylepis.1